MQQIRYGFKASAFDAKQIENRFKLSRALFLKDFICELYLDGVNLNHNGTRKKIINNLSHFNGVYSLHVPIINHRNIFYDPKRIKLDFIGLLADIANKLNNAMIILHRCWNFNSKIRWKEASERYQEWIWKISSNYPSSLFLVENFGFVFRRMAKKIKLYMSPLDHFFPQEIDYFDTWLKKNNITNVYPFIDIAHANSTLNLLKAWKLNSKKTKIFFHSSLHERINKKIFYFDCIEDYISKKIYPYFHISDSCSLSIGTDYEKWLSYFTSEGLALGEGNIKWRAFFKKITELFNKVTFIMEVNMKELKNGIEQKRSIQFSRKVIQDIHDEEGL